MISQNKNSSYYNHFDLLVPSQLKFFYPERPVAESPALPATNSTFFCYATASLQNHNHQSSHSQMVQNCSALSSELFGTIWGVLGVVEPIAMPSDWPLLPKLQKKATATSKNCHEQVRTVTIATSATPVCLIWNIWSIRVYQACSKSGNCCIYGVCSWRIWLLIFQHSRQCHSKQYRFVSSHAIFCHKIIPTVMNNILVRW